MRLNAEELYSKITYTCKCAHSNLTSKDICIFGKGKVKIHLKCPVSAQMQ